MRSPQTCVRRNRPSPAPVVETTTGDLRQRQRKQLPGAPLGHHHAIEHYPGTQSNASRTQLWASSVTRLRINCRPVIGETSLQSTIDFGEKAGQKRVRGDVKPLVGKKPLLESSRKSRLVSARTSDDEDRVRGHHVRVTVRPDAPNDRAPQRHGAQTSGASAPPWLGRDTLFIAPRLGCQHAVHHVIDKVVIEPLRLPDGAFRTECQSL